jgi:hypothetical protein
MAAYGGLWRPMVAYGVLWRPMAAYGGLWRPMAAYGGQYWHMQWQPIAVYGGPWPMDFTFTRQDHLFFYLLIKSIFFIDLRFKINH